MTTDKFPVGSFARVTARAPGRPKGVDHPRAGQRVEIVGAHKDVRSVRFENGELVAFNVCRLERVS